jgi:hypothetical protein
MTAGEAAERWIRLGAAVVAPVTLISTLLFYFGYVSTRAAYEYFGVDVDVVGLGTQDFVLRSPRPLLLPMLVILLLAALALVAHLSFRGRIDNGAIPAHVVRISAWVGTGAGAAVLVTGVILVLVYPQVDRRAVLDLVIPVCVVVGTALVGYGRYLLRRSGASDSEQGSRTASVAVTTLMVGVIIGGTFWATATVAEWSGRGEAVDLSGRLNELPSVIVDTTERLYVLNPDIRERQLPDEPDQRFRYRYENLRLLVHGDDRMFLVPATWSASGTTLMVPLNEDVRVQFQFLNPG